MMERARARAAAKATARRVRIEARRRERAAALEAKMEGLSPAQRGEYTRWLHWARQVTKAHLRVREGQRDLNYNRPHPWYPNTENVHVHESHDYLTYDKLPDEPHARYTSINIGGVVIDVKTTPSRNHTDVTLSGLYFGSSAWDPRMGAPFTVRQAQCICALLGDQFQHRTTFSVSDSAATVWKFTDATFRIKWSALLYAMALAPGEAGSSVSIYASGARPATDMQFTPLSRLALEGDASAAAVRDLLEPVYDQWRDLWARVCDAKAQQRRAVNQGLAAEGTRPEVRHTFLKLLHSNETVVPENVGDDMRRVLEAMRSMDLSRNVTEMPMEQLKARVGILDSRAMPLYRLDWQRAVTEQDIEYALSRPELTSVRRNLRL